ncbi:alpha/beta hydrolase [Rhodococcus hoagii]|nr:alpha/beta hydrolase [Prescottella equi]
MPVRKRARNGEGGAPSLIVLVLPGGKVRDRRRSRRWQAADLRMRLFTSILRRGCPDARVRQVRYRLRGWNGADSSPVHDVRGVLDDLRPAGVSVVLIGHSMGGRVAAAVADDPSVSGVLALAPWWPDGEGACIPTGVRMVVVHGTADTWTDPAVSRKQAVLARARGVDARWIGMPGAGHTMLRNPGRWHRIAIDFVRDQSRRRTSPNVS